MGSVSSCKTKPVLVIDMPFFWSGSGNGNDRTKLEHKMCVAKETPEPVFDLSDCNLPEIPSGVFSMCRVFRKEVLLLHGNKLTSLNGGGSLQDLSLLKVLDLHSNRINKLPEEVVFLSSLQVLNLKNNKLKKLPQSIGNLRCLEVLDIGGNKFSEFPLMLCKLPRLHTLYITNNKIAHLPKELSEITTLSTIELDAEKFEYPSSEMCKEGTESIMRFLCRENGREYAPPMPVDSVVNENCSEIVNVTEPDFSATYDLYQRAKERRRLDLIHMEEEMLDNQESQAQIAADTQLRRQKLLENVAEEQEKLQDEILLLQSKKEKEKQRLIYALSCLEDDSAKLIDEVMKMNEKSKNTEALLELIERDREEAKELFSLKQDELESLRKKEVINAMREMLEAEEKQRQYEAGRLELTKQLHKSPFADDERILNILSGREQDQMAMINDLLEEEEYQKQAFEVLQVQRDLKHLELTHHIKLIQKELTKLTTAELKKKNLKLNMEMNVLAERRATLAELLSNLLEQRDRREQELKKRILEMDKQREQEMNDFWLIQYQRLMDRKPQHIEELEQILDPSIKHILSDAEAQEFIPLFASKQVTLDKLLTMTHKDLKSLGIISDNICDNIIKSANSYYLSLRKNIELEERPTSVSPSDEVLPSVPPSEDEQRLPSAPPTEEDTERPSAPLLSPGKEMKVWYQIECVVCMDKQSQTVFLPCGHVCCCLHCGESVLSCPMCRADIANRFLLNVS